jgi:hypothetical protein
MKIILVLFVIFAGIYLWIQKVNELTPAKTKVKTKEDIGKFYYLKKSLFTPTEYIFYQELQKQNNNKYIIHSKVRLEDLVGVAKGVGDRHREMRNHIKSRHVDFFITEHSGEIVAVIELDDKSHDTEKAKIGDEIKNQIFAFNQIRFYRVGVGKNYSEEVKDILEMIKNI